MPFAPVLLLLPALSLSLPPLPVRSFHGYASSCSSLSLRDLGTCVETGARLASMTASMSSQASAGCQALRAEEAALRGGFHIVAYSQGGLIARHILHRCTPINGYIRRIVFVGTPHLGIGGRLLAYQDYAREGAASPPFLSDVSSLLWDPLYANLDFVVNLVSRTESTVRPASSTAMGAKYDPSGRFESLGKVPYVQERQRGLAKLFQEGQLWNCLSSGPHNRPTRDEVRLLYGVLLAEAAGVEDRKTSALVQLEKFLGMYPNPCSGKK